MLAALNSFAKTFPHSTCRRLKAHLDADASTDSDDRFKRQGNNLVDASPKVAARSHPQPDPLGAQA
eukprot:6998627-Pyramimonas_sp.AAC.1